MILEPPKTKSLVISIVSSSICYEVIGLDTFIFLFWMLSFKPALSLSSFTFIKRLFSSSSLSVIRVVSYLHIWGYWYFPQQSWFQLVLHPAQHFAWCTLCIVKYVGWHTFFPILNQSVVLCPVLTVASWPGYRFLRRQARWSGIPISWRIFHSLLWSTQSKALAESIKQK